MKRKKRYRMVSATFSIEGPTDLGLVALGLTTDTLKATAQIDSAGARDLAFRLWEASRNADEITREQAIADACDDS